MSEARFIWHDLMSTDAPRALAFYAELFGWRADGNVLCDAAGPVAAVLPFAPAAGFASHWVPYVGARDLEAFTRAVVAAGGATCMASAPHPLGGRFAFVSDGEGASFSALEGGPRGGGFSCDKLLSNDLARGAAFYARVLGWRADARGGHTVFVDGDAPAAWMIARPPVSPGVFWLAHVAVADLDGCVGRARRLGGTVLVAPRLAAGMGRYAVLLDPAGAPIAAITPEGHRAA